jgi:hypothetical protein
VEDVVAWDISNSGMDQEKNEVKRPGVFGRQRWIDKFQVVDE